MLKKLSSRKSYQKLVEMRTNTEVDNQIRSAKK